MILNVDEIKPTAVRTSLVLVLIHTTVTEAVQYTRHLTLDYVQHQYCGVPGT